MTTHNRKTKTVEAHELKEDSLDFFKEWMKKDCVSVVVEHLWDEERQSHVSKIKLMNIKDSKVQIADYDYAPVYLGSYICKDETGKFYAVSKKEFEEEYE